MVDTLDLFQNIIEALYSPSQLQVLHRHITEQALYPWYVDRTVTCFKFSQQLCQYYLRTFSCEIYEFRS